MRGTPLVPMIALRELGRLLDVHRRPAHYPTDDEQLARLFVEHCGDISAEQFTQAVTAYLKSDARFFPKPGELRALAERQPGATAFRDDAVAQYWCWERGDRPFSAPYQDTEGHFAPCPACGRGISEYGRIRLVHEHHQHRALGLPCIGYCNEPNCAGPGKAPAAPPAREGAAA